MWVPIPHLKLPVWLASERYNNFLFLWTESRGYDFSGLKFTVFTCTQLWHGLLTVLSDHINDLEPALLPFHSSLTDTEILAILRDTDMGDGLSAFKSREEDLLSIFDLVEDDVVSSHEDQHAILLCQEESILHILIDSKKVSRQ